MIRQAFYRQVHPSDSPKLVVKDCDKCSRFDPIERDCVAFKNGDYAGMKCWTPMGCVFISDEREEPNGIEIYENYSFQEEIRNQTMRWFAAKRSGCFMVIDEKEEP